MSLSELEAIPGAFDFEGGFHRADWPRIGQWIQSNVPADDYEQAWNTIALAWVNKLRDDLGGDYFVVDSRRTILLCDLSRELAARLLNYAGRAVETIREQLGPAAWERTCGKDVVLVFSDLDDYDQYLAFHNPDGEQAASGGVCIHSGYTHIAIPWRDELDAVSTIIHELSHDCVAHLPLPLWLNEGVAVTLQKALAPLQRSIGQNEQDALFQAAIDWRPPIMSDELAQRHFAFWNETNIQEFWAGTSFYKPGDSNELSYSLAEVFLKLMTGQTKPAEFREFLRHAEQADAGQTAAIEILQVQLADIAARFLGDGNWQPKRKRMIELWDQAGWKKADDGKSNPLTD